MPISKNNRLQPDNKRVQSLGLKYITVTQVFLFIFWPFGQMITTVRQFRRPGFMALLWLFFVYFGFVFVYSDPFGRGVSSDSARYAASLIELHSHPGSFDALWSSLYSADTKIIDIYQSVLTWFISLFTGDPAFLFAAFAAVFGFFYVKNLWIVFSRISVKVGLILFLFMMSYALVNPIWNINGVRMWTAAQVFLYGNLLFFLYNDKRGLLWSVSSLLFHFSFAFPVGLLLAWQFIPRKNRLIWPVFIFFIATSFISEINLLGVRNMLSFMPKIFQLRVSSYTNDVYAQAMATKEASVNWQVVLAGNVSKWIVYAWVTISFIKRKEWKGSNENYFHLFLFALFLGGFANLASNVPSGARFVTLSNALFYALFVLLLGKNYLKSYWLKIITVPFISFAVIFLIRLGFDFIGILTVAGNPLMAPFYGTQTPLINFIKGFF